LFGEIGEACDLESRLEVSGSMQVEILTNGGRRRHWSPEERTRIVAETLAAGAKVSEVARTHAIAPSLIFAWRREARAKRAWRARGSWLGASPCRCAASSWRDAEHVRGTARAPLAAPTDITQ
jgi:transposase-like protein